MKSTPTLLEEVGQPPKACAMSFRVLGPVQVYRDGRPIPLAPKEQALLAALLLQANTMVPGGRLVEQIWGEPASGPTKNTLHVLIRRLRRALQSHDDGVPPAELVHTRSGGYLLTIAPGDLDVNRFEELVREATRVERAGDLELAVRYLRAGLALWRGPALEGVAAVGLQRVEVPRLEERRLAVLERRIEMELSLGRHVELVSELTALVVEHPLFEGFHGQLMRALYGAGRQADALAVYSRLYRLLAEELALEPTLTLQCLQQAILRGEPSFAKRLSATHMDGV
jgi:SARP family transcriptional regulator, regulator of embCAB operon